MDTDDGGGGCVDPSIPTIEVHYCTLHSIDRSDSRLSSFREHHISIHISRNRRATGGPAGEGFGGEHDNYTWRNSH